MLIVIIIEIIIIIYLLKREFGKVLSDEELQKKYGHLHYFKNGRFHPRKTADYNPKNVTKPDKKCIEIKSFGLKSPQGPKFPFNQIQLNKFSFNSSPDNFSIYWLGHSSTIIEINHYRIIIDPVLDNASPMYFGVERYTKRVIERNQLPDMDYIILTHNHYDHLERKTVISFKKGHFIVPLGLKYTLENWGINKNRITELGWGDKFTDEEGIEIIGEEANHFSGRYLLDANKTLFNSYIISGGGKNIFWSGDTGYSGHFKDIYNKYKIDFDLVALECDAYNTGWKNSHLFPHEVIQAAKDLKTKNLFPIHWGVFDLAFHPWHESVDTIISEAILNNIKVFTPMLGEKFNTEKETQTWWK